MVFFFYTLKFNVRKIRGLPIKQKQLTREVGSNIFKKDTGTMRWQWRCIQDINSHSSSKGCFFQRLVVASLQWLFSEDYQKWCGIKIKLARGKKARMRSQVMWKLWLYSVTVLDNNSLAMGSAVVSDMFHCFNGWKYLTFFYFSFLWIATNNREYFCRTCFHYSSRQYFFW